MLAIREQSWLFASDFPLCDMQNTVKCPYKQIVIKEIQCGYDCNYKIVYNNYCN